MKIKYFILLGVVLAALGCKKDNYKAPTITFKGRIIYNGEAVNVEYDRVPIDLYQPGFGKTGAIRGQVDQEGNYSFLLFAGDYKLTIPANQGPFRWKELGAGRRDTLAVKVSGDQTLDLEVQPYYMVRNAQLTAASGKVNATFNLEKVITDANARNIERVNLYINKTQFVSGTDNIANTELAGSAITSLSNIAMSVNIPSLTPTQNYVYARIGVKIDGVEDMIFSPLVKLTY